MTLYLPSWVTVAARKKMILEFLRRSAARGLIGVELHEAGTRSDSCRSMSALWKYDDEMELLRIQTVVDDVDRCIDDAYRRRATVYSGATITVFDGQGPTSSHEFSPPAAGGSSL